MEKNLKTLNQREKEQLWASRVLDCRESGLTVVKWCKENNVKVPTFYSWQRKLFQKATQEVKFTEISLLERHEAPSNCNTEKIVATITIQGITAEIHAGSTPDDIKNLVRGLKSC